jgi:hypothetical protein
MTDERWKGECSERFRWRCEQECRRRFVRPFHERRVFHPSFRAVCLSALIFLAAAASPATAQQLELLRKMPSDLLRYTGGARPNADGMASYNKEGFKSPEFQSGAMHYLVRAIVRRDERCTAEGWSAIDATFRYQTDAGGFGQEGAPHGGPSAAAFWLAELDQAVFVLRESELGPKYKERIDRLLPKIHKAARWLAEPRNRAI